MATYLRNTIATSKMKPFVILLPVLSNVIQNSISWVVGALDLPLEHYNQSFLHENHCQCYKNFLLVWRLWPVLFASTYFVLILYLHSLQLQNKNLLSSLCFLQPVIRPQITVQLVLVIACLFGWVIRDCLRMHFWRFWNCSI